MHVKRFILTALSLLVACASFAQGPSALPKAENITNGVLPDGISYYIAVNDIDKGRANITLVQQGVTDEQEARAALEGYEFLASKGIGYGTGGYVHIEAGSAVYEFDSVPMFDQAASDSTLLFVFNIIRRSPYSQALIIAGDVDPAKCLQQLQLLSLSVPSRTAIAETEVYQWNASSEVKVALVPNKTESLANITLVYNWPRVPAEVMGSTRPLISRMLSREMGTILTERLSGAFRKAGIPISGIETDSIDSSETASDEQYVINLGTSKDKVIEALKLASYTLANLDKTGATPSEIRRAKAASAAAMQAEACRTYVTNAEYAAKCKAAYLYGASLASPVAVNDYFRKRVLAPEVELDLFNKFCSAILSPTSNLSIVISSPGTLPSADEVIDAFVSSWTPEPGYELPEYAEPAFPAFKAKKSKLKSTITDPVTGGSIWTYANGFKVVFKQVKGSGGFNYSFVTRGGYPQISSLGSGESAFVEDVLAGFNLPCGSFMVDETSLKIRGTASADSLSTVLKGILDFINNPECAIEDMDYFRSGEALRIQQENMYSTALQREIARMTAPDYRFAAVKNIDNLSGELPAKLTRYLESQFSRCDDGALVIIGDLDPDKVKEQIGRIAGNFPTGKKMAVKAREPFPMLKGWYTYSSEAATGELGTASPEVMSQTTSQLPFSLKNSMVLDIATELVRVKMAKIMAAKGISGRVMCDISFYPVERASLWLAAAPCPQEGLPKGVKPGTALDALAALRAAQLRISRGEFSEKDFENARTVVDKSYQFLSSDATYLMWASEIRVAEGKNILSGYQQHLKSVTPEDVTAVMNRMQNNLIVEYVNR